MSIAYCCRCKSKQEMVNEKMEEKLTSRGLKKFIRGNCKVCGGKVVLMVGR